MVLIILFFFIEIAVLGKLCEKTWVNPLTLFSAIFTVMVYLASLGLYNMREVSSTPYIIIGVGVVSFAVGYLLYHNKPFKVRISGRRSTIAKKEYVCRELVFKIFMIMSIIAWLIIAAMTIGELMSGIPYKVVRDNYGRSFSENPLFSSSYVNFFVKWVLVPMVHVIVAKTVYSIFDLHYTKSYYIGALVVLAAYVFSTGSRIILLYTVVQIVFLFFVRESGRRKKFNISRKIKRGVTLAVMLAAIAIVVVTSFRPSTAGSTTSTNATIYAYGAVAVPLLDNWVEYVNGIGIRTHGITFIFGILQWLARLKIPMPAFYYDCSDIISFCSDTSVAIFGSNRYNAFDTVFFYFYLDFGYIGVILGSFIFGLMSCGMYRMVRREQNEYISVMFLVFLIALVGSFARWQFTTAPYIMMYVLVRMMYQKKKWIADLYIEEKLEGKKYER